MAGNTMRMNVGEVQAAISNFDSRSHEFQDVINAIKSIFFDLEGTWTGAAERAYESQLRELLQNIQTILQSIQGAKGKLQTAIQAYEQVEQTNVSGITNLDEGQSDYIV